jgi:hypothetical protein
MTKAATICQRDLLRRCVSIDLEVDPAQAKIFAFAAVTQDRETPDLLVRSDIPGGLRKLEDFCWGFQHIIGHSILGHDLPYLAAASPRLLALAEAPIDTLWLNPLAFPRNPYHHLVKHYQDGRLQTGRVNDPAFDAQLVFEVLENQIAAFAGRQREGHAALTATAKARVGDPVALVFEGDRWLLTDASGRSLGRMAKSFAAPAGARFLRGEVAAILRWHKDDSDESYHHMLKRETWEVVIPELVFEAI